MPEIPIAAARAALERRARALGFDAAAAALLADHFLDAELRGAASHGLERLRWLAGVPADRRARPRLAERREGLARYRSEGAVGYVALAHALDAETADAPAGARLVVVEDCFPTGRLGWFAERVARAGLGVLLTATSTPRIGHPDGGPPLLGTNPLCLGLPDGADASVVDVSMGRVTYGEVLAAAATGRALPAGAARDEAGAAVVDPALVIADAAAIVPFGGDQAHKGFALAALVELLAGALAPGPGHAAVALVLRPAGAAATLARLRAGADGRRLPGERSRAALAAAQSRGTVAVADDLWDWLSGG